MPMGEMGDYQFIQAHGDASARSCPSRRKCPASGWLYYIGVDDIDRATRAITDGGGQKLYDPMEIPAASTRLTRNRPAGREPSGWSAPETADARAEEIER